MVDVKKLLESARAAAASGGTMDWTADAVQVNGVNFGRVTVNGLEDSNDFLRVLEAVMEKRVASPVAAIAPVDAQVLAALPEVEAAPRLADEIKTHLGDLERRKLNPDTITESRHSLRIFLALTGDIPVREIKASHVRAFLDAVRWWPERATVRPQYRGMSVLEIIEAGKRERVPVSPHTYNKHQSRLGVFLNALVNQDLLSKNPLKAIKPEIDTSTDLDTGRAFTPDELSAMFEPARFRAWATSPHRWWGPMIGLYTGARVSEVAQLYIDDVREVDGIWGLFFWKNARGQKIKNKASIRFVPLAQPLLEAGFLDFVEDMRQTGHPRLFPHLPAGTKKDGTPNGKGYGRQLSRQFGAYVKTIGVEKGTGFHSFRHTMSTVLAEQGIPEREIALITGHAITSQVPTLARHYIHIADTASLPRRVEVLASFTPSLKLQSYQRAQFAPLLSTSANLHQ
ncbi:site-specific integrase [Luteimonas fraxinea]|uniref:Site-specific integrase n=1 Tax=Luteimonas fraxinea TaxID=2901869 RepID=A0ABS8UGV3_9GAMM|nr:site-specific integrase [Luteimonas fraxinea]MCD9098072.1 site-specific integrase [Luteimonas fraxinea]UHH09202.1 site-specific integrase [Luteimonas fraxinea]